MIFIDYAINMAYFRFLLRHLVDIFWYFLKRKIFLSNFRLILEEITENKSKILKFISMKYNDIIRQLELQGF